MAIYMWREYIPPKALCFTANTGNSTVQLTKTWSPTAVTLETSTDGNTRTTYTFWNTITLSNIWDKVYWRNTSTTDTGFSTGIGNNYKFVMSGSIAASWDVTYLLNKNNTNTLSSWCFSSLFSSCSSLTSVPKLSATILSDSCYRGMFVLCTNIETLPNLPATNLAGYCYMSMFNSCSKIKLSSTQTWEYQTPYRIPNEWTWTTASSRNDSMFAGTWWTFTWTPSINTTYYTSNQVI